MANPYRSIVHGAPVPTPDTRLFHPAPDSLGEMSTKLLTVVGVTGFFGIPVGAIMTLGGVVTGGMGSAWTKTGLKVLGGSTVAFLSVVTLNKFVVAVPGYANAPPIFPKKTAT